jgi:hypothetical protein
MPGLKPPAHKHSGRQLVGRGFSPGVHAFESRIPNPESRGPIRCRLSPATIRPWCVVKEQAENRLFHAVRLQRVQVPPR